MPFSHLKDATPSQVREYALPRVAYREEDLIIVFSEQGQVLSV